jgi:hypothetical protein
MAEKTGYEQIGIDEIREILRTTCGVTDEEVLGQTKKPLVSLLLEKQEETQDLAEKEMEKDSIAVPEMSDEATNDMFNEAVEEDVEHIVSTDPDEDGEIPIPEVVPAFGSKEWQDYVMRQFRENELSDGCPTCVGCHRLVGQLIGPIVGTGIPDHDPPTKENRGTATVVVSIDVEVTNETHPAAGRVIHLEDIADVNKENTDAPYCKHQSATAATRAAGRIYRKLLDLTNTITAEEDSDIAEKDNPFEEGWSPSEPISDEQIQAIDLICGRKNMNVMELINLGDNKYSAVETVSRATAQKMLQYLNNIQRGKYTAPKDVGPYKSNWRN